MTAWTASFQNRHTKTALADMWVNELVCLLTKTVERKEIWNKISVLYGIKNFIWCGGTEIKNRKHKQFIQQLYMKSIRQQNHTQDMSEIHVQAFGLMHHISATVPDPAQSHLTLWGQVTHICVGNLTIIGSDNGLSPGRRQAITWTNVGILLIGPPGTNFSEMLIEIHTF